MGKIICLLLLSVCVCVCGVCGVCVVCVCGVCVCVCVCVYVHWEACICLSEHCRKCICVNTWKIILDTIQKWSHGSVAELWAFLGKTELVPVHTMKARGGSTGLAPLILNLHTIWRWVLSCCTPRKELRYPVNRRLGGPHSWSGRFGKETNLFVPDVIYYTDWAVMAA